MMLFRSTLLAALLALLCVIPMAQATELKDGTYIEMNCTVTESPCFDSSHPKYWDFGMGIAKSLGALYDAVDGKTLGIVATDAENDPQVFTERADGSEFDTKTTNDPFVRRLQLTCNWACPPFWMDPYHCYYNCGGGRRNLRSTRKLSQKTIDRQAVLRPMLTKYDDDLTTDVLDDCLPVGVQALKCDVAYVKT